LPAGTKIAVLGFGPEARERAAWLRAAGYDVTIGLRPGGMSWVRAAADGYKPAPTSMAVADADVVALMVPDEDQPSVYWNAVAPHLAPNALLVFGHGLALYTGAVEPAGTDTVVVSKSDDGCRVAVHHDASGGALERAIAFARAAFEPGTKVDATSIATEAEAELDTEERRAGSPAALVAELDAEIASVARTHEADEMRLAYYERLRATLGRRDRGSMRIPLSASSGTVAVVPEPRLRGVA
jgi:ketol-acid reductoisomerase